MGRLKGSGDSIVTELYFVIFYEGDWVVFHTEVIRCLCSFECTRTQKVLISALLLLTSLVDIVS